jgi:hypothetical protein
MSAKNSLHRLAVSSPCSQDWNSMIGNDRVRFCEHCSLHVHNLSEMTRVKALRLIENFAGSNLHPLLPRSKWRSGYAVRFALVISTAQTRIASCRGRFFRDLECLRGGRSKPFGCATKSHPGGPILRSMGIGRSSRRDDYRPKRSGNSGRQRSAHRRGH